MNYDTIELSTDLLQLISNDQAWHYCIIPKDQTENKIEFYISDKISKETNIDELEIIFNKEIELEIIPDETIRKLLSKHYRINKSKKSTITKSDFQNSDDFLSKIIAEANSIGCSDIHIERYENKCRVRYRLDGKLIERYILKSDQYPSFVNRIKISSHLDIAEKRMPQDGRMIFDDGAEQFDIRVSILPTLFGEKVVLRLLRKDTATIDLKKLGFSDVQHHQYSEAIKSSHGIILISGPTGSGKTTTLYATLKILNKDETNILTIEDPIEYTLEGINQVQLKENIGLTYDSAIKTFLRQDPDIIMLGEIRDAKTAQMAIRAALTGHLVLSTIHTNSAAGTISRLIDMGIPPFLLSNSLVLSVAQRLVRVLCNTCKKEIKFDSKLLPEKFNAPVKIDKHYKSVGCEDCHYTGYSGRKAIYELIPIDSEYAEAIKKPDFDFNNLSKEKEIPSLADTAFFLLKEGVTSLDEVYPILTTLSK